MAYDKEVLSAALRDLEIERGNRERELEQRKQEVYAKLPRVRVIENALRTTAANVIRAALESGDDPSEAIAKLRTQNLALQQEREALLVRNGFVHGYLTLQPACPACSDLGYIGTQLCECLKARYAKKLTESLSTVLPIHDQNFSTFRLDYYDARIFPAIGMSPRENMEDNLAECRMYANRFGKKGGHLLLYGSAGLGKTFLSTCIAGEITEKGFSVAYDTAISILSHFETVKFRGAEATGATQQLRKYRKADLLIIDDLGAEMTTSFTISALYELMNDRLMANASMIINTNLMPADLEKRYSPAIASRILGNFSQLRFFGDDIRILKRHGKLFHK